MLRRRAATTTCTRGLSRASWAGPSTACRAAPSTSPSAPSTRRSAPPSPGERPPNKSPRLSCHKLDLLRSESAHCESMPLSFWTSNRALCVLYGYNVGVDFAFSYGDKVYRAAWLRAGGMHSTASWGTATTARSPLQIPTSAKHWRASPRSRCHSRASTRIAIKLVKMARTGTKRASCHAPWRFTLQPNLRTQQVRLGGIPLADGAKQRIISSAACECRSVSRAEAAPGA